MGKLSSLITTAVFIGAVAVLVYFCCRVKRKRNLTWNNWQDAFRQNPNQQACEGGQNSQTNVHPAMGPGPASYDSHVPHSIVNPNVSYPYGQPYPYPDGQTYPGQHAIPYPVGQPNMPMPGMINYDARQMQPAPYTYPPRHPDDLPPPYSAVVGPNAPKY
ncbi:unnamed protein product [Allacma fusca]|uniref:Uncharacterized protein n=1 Tax=Allacma fusca TaxID=39272 RepID=A0A8J2Q0E7_9HEXA|nr:unnamed protein product [Allacma fusca]